MLVKFQKVVDFFNLKSLHFNSLKAKIIEPKAVSQDLLIEVAKLEKFLYKNRFTRRVILEVKDPTNVNKSYYRFYYYQLIDGIHAFIEVPSKNFNRDNFKIYFQTIYENGTIKIDSNKKHYIFDAVPESIEFSSHKDSDIENLYMEHLESRDRKQDILKKRLIDNELIKSEAKKEQLAIEELVKRGLAKYSDNGFKLLPTYMLWSNTQNIANLLGIKRNRIKIILGVLFSYIAVLTLIFGAYYLLKSVDTKPKTKVVEIKDYKKELSEFKKRVASYQGLTIMLSNGNKYTLEESFKDIDKYLKSSKIKRFIGKPLTEKIDPSGLPCKVPKQLEKIYRWHNGIEMLIPNRDMFRYKDFKLTYNAFKDKLPKDNSNLVFVFASKYDYRGLAYDCNKTGLYEYALNSKTPGLKEFYNFNHFLKIVAQSYKSGAFYDDYDSVNVDLKKFFKVYHNYLSRGDKARYNSLISLLKQKAKLYKNAPKELKLTLLEEIAKSYDSQLIDSVKIYLNDSNKEVVAKAIEALGNVGSKSALPLLKKYLKSKNIQFRDFALMAIAKIVDNKDKGLLEYIYPMLNDKFIMVRLSAYGVIAKIKDRASLNILHKKFENEKLAAKLEIIKIFGEIGGEKELNILQNYLKKVEKMDFSKKLTSLTKGNNPHPTILKYETLRAIDKISTCP